MHIIYRAANITEAHIIKGMLNTRGIDAEVGGYYLQGGIGELATMDFANVLVEQEDTILARQIISEYEGQGDTQFAPIDEPDSIRPVLIFVLGILVLIGLLATIQ